MRFVETSVFTRQVVDLLPDEDYRSLQNFLILYPSSGKLIKGSGGLRKLRWKLRASGKRGGTRLIYFWHGKNAEIFMLYLYAKQDQTDLTPTQVKVLRRVVEEELQ